MNRSLKEDGMTPNAVITGWGMYAPSRVMTNDELSTMVDTSDEWIVSRTGIRERRIAADDETTTTLSVNAARDALAVAGVDASEVDLVIVGTCSPDYPLPATAVLVADRAGRDPRRRLRPAGRLLRLPVRAGHRRAASSAAACTARCW